MPKDINKLNLKQLEKEYKVKGQLLDSSIKYNNAISTNKDEIERVNSALKKRREAIEKSDISESKRKKLLDEINGFEKEKRDLYKESNIHLRSFITNQNDFSKTFKHSMNVIDKQLFDSVQSFSNSLGLNLPKNLKEDPKVLRQIFGKTIEIEELKNKFEADKMKNLKDHWYLVEDGMFAPLHRIGRGFQSEFQTLKEGFFNKTGILGSTFKMIGKIGFGKNWGAEGGVGREKENLERNKATRLDTLAKLEGIFSSLSENGISLDEEKYFNMMLKLETELDIKRQVINDKKNKDKKENLSGESIDGETKVKKSFKRGNQEDPNLEETKKSNKILKLILLKSTAKKMGAGLMGLLALGGLAGFLVTGKSEFLGDMIKMARHSNKIISGLLKRMIKLPEFILKRFGSGGNKIGTKITKLLGKPFEWFDTMRKFIFRPIRAFAGQIEKFSKYISRVPGIGKIAQKVTGVIGKKLGKAGLKRIPGLGQILSIMFAINRFKKGDTIGGLLELASGAAGFLDLLVPGLGFGVGMAIDLFSMGRDVKMAMNGTSGENKPVWKKGPRNKSLDFITKPDFFGNPTINPNQQDDTNISDMPQVQSYTSNRVVSKNPNDTRKFDRGDLDYMISGISKGTGREFDSALKNNQTGGYSAGSI